MLMVPAAAIWPNVCGHQVRCDRPWGELVVDKAEADAMRGQPFLHLLASGLCMEFAPEVVI
eukprot:IDg3400t1